MLHVDATNFDYSPFLHGERLKKGRKQVASGTTLMGDTFVSPDKSLANMLILSSRNSLPNSRFKIILIHKEARNGLQV